MKTDAAARNLLLTLLLTAVTINYIDRGSLSVAAPLLVTEFSLTPIEMGLLLSAFFWSYALLQIIVGWMVDRWEVKWIYAAGFVLWSLATFATGLVQSFTALFLMRLFLGIGESVNYPACSKILARHFPEEKRGFANGLVDGGSKIGPALSTLVGGLLVSEFGWRALFLGVGLTSLLWLWPWLQFAPTASPTPGQSPDFGPSWSALLQRIETWGTSLGMFALGYVWYFLLTWLPSYLVKERGLSLSSMAVLGSLPFWGMAVTSIAGGWLSDRFISAGHSPTRVRKIFVLIGLFFCAVFMFPSALISNTSVSLILLIAACLSLGIFTSNVWAITQTLAGPAAAGKWAGFQNAIGNLGGVVSPAISGFLLQETGSFLLPFAAASVILLLGMLSYIFLVKRIVPIDWVSVVPVDTTTRPPSEKAPPPPQDAPPFPKR